jgi:hypothetical protein
MSISGVTERSRSYDAFRAAEEQPNSNDGAEQLKSEDAPGTALLLLDGDIAAQIAALAILSAQKQRDSNRDLQTKEEAALERAEAAQVDAMHEQADDIRLAGLLEGVSGAGSGALRLAGDFSIGVGTTQKLANLGAMTDGVGRGIAAIPKADEADDRANAAAYEHQAGHHRRASDAARDSIREGQDLLERALDFYKQSQQGAADAKNASVRRG